MGRLYTKIEGKYIELLTEAEYASVINIKANTLETMRKQYKVKGWNFKHKYLKIKGRIWYYF